MFPRRRDTPQRLGGTVLHNLGRRLLGGLSCAVLLVPSSNTGAFEVTIAPASPKTIYLQVGVGTFTGFYCGNNCNSYPPIPPNTPTPPIGTPGNNNTVNTVSVSVAATVVGNGTAQTMTTNSTQSNSFYDGFAFCTAPAQLYIGGFYRTTAAGTGSINVTATVPASLTDAAGDTLSFGTISWTSSGAQDTGAEPFPSATFAPGTVQTVGSIAQNQWAESCWTFSYANKTVPAAGTYTGTVTYTATAP
jgi:hypothetical protein